PCRRRCTCRLHAFHRRGGERLHARHRARLAADRASMKTLARWLWRVGRGILLALAALVFAIEEWGWRPLTAIAARLARWAPIGRLEQRIREAPPAVALGLYLVPALLLFPIKVVALWLISLGKTFFGVSVIVLAKV